MGSVTVHYSEGIKWQNERINQMAAGLHQLGFHVITTSSRQRVSEHPAVLFGTTLWRGIEEAPGDWLLVDRASYGDPEFVQLVWNGRGLRGDHKVPWQNPGPKRWQEHGVKLSPPVKGGKKILLCGDDNAPLEWYAEMAPHCTHFKPHPAIGGNPTGLPIANSFADVKEVHVYNSSVAIECLIRGIPISVADKGCLAYNVQGPVEQFFRWLAWTQWSWEEIEQGEPIRHLFAWLQKSEASASLAAS